MNTVVSSLYCLAPAQSNTFWIYTLERCTHTITLDYMPPLTQNGMNRATAKSEVGMGNLLNNDIKLLVCDHCETTDTKSKLPVCNAIASLEGTTLYTAIIMTNTHTQQILYNFTHIPHSSMDSGVRNVEHTGHCSDSKPTVNEELQLL